MLQPKHLPDGFMVVSSHISRCPAKQQSAESCARQMFIQPPLEASALSSEKGSSGAPCALKRRGSEKSKSQLVSSLKICVQGASVCVCRCLPCNRLR